ncbi:MAG: hypothetical protein WCI57_00975 [Candidatus Berkelbacteria bacterium]
MLVNLIVILAIVSAISYSKQLILERDQDFLSEGAKQEKKINQNLIESLQNLQSRSDELEKLNKYMTGRELKMIELKKRVAELEKINKQ